MRNRMVQGFFRYGSLHSPELREKAYDNVSGAIRRLERYRADGNIEHLVDAANLCLMEFMVPNCHESPSFRSIDDGEHLGSIR
jgi:hypothetical protein